MSWLARRLDHLGSAAAGGVGGLGFSQAPAFTHAYLQRLGGHIDEARRTIDKLAAGDILPWLGGDGREQAVAELTVRLAQLERLQQVLLDSPAILRPFSLLRHADWSIARGAADAFVPAVPIDPASIVWTLIGVILAALAWDATKIPFWAAGKTRARREARQAASRPSPKPRQKSGKPRRPAGDLSASRETSD
ncbi:MAG TPA: DUF2937 family protein [Wenzhouxiangellaceae bacterium]|nr:DUF2937 family protein [Wenzhouxiangellaceae bacterium]